MTGSAGVLRRFHSGWVSAFAGLLLAGEAIATVRLPTDPALRQGMNDIRSAVIDHHTLITHRRLPVAMARTFASHVSRSVVDIRRETEIPEDARRVLDPLLETIDSSAQTIGAGGDSIRQMDALFAMTKALETYGRSFEDADWKPIQER